MIPSACVRCLLLVIRGSVGICKGFFRVQSYNGKSFFDNICKYYNVNITISYNPIPSVHNNYVLVITNDPDSI